VFPSQAFTLLTPCRIQSPQYVVVLCQVCGEHAVVGFCPDVCTGFNEGCHRFSMAILRCIMQRGPIAFFPRIDIRSGLDEIADLFRNPTL